MFVDASAIVAILTLEPDADVLTRALNGAGAPITSPVAVFEATLAVLRKRPGSLAEVRSDIEEFLSLAAIQVVPITEAEAATALDAFDRYGKGRGHPARLNMGDCFAYAAAKNYGAALLFKGGDFGKTDLPSAAPAVPD